MNSLHARLHSTQCVAAALLLGCLAIADIVAAQEDAVSDRTGPVSNAPVVGPNTYRSGLDDLLARATENHPDVAAAKAKVALAEAELKSKRLEVARDIISLYEGMREQESTVKRCEASLSEFVKSNSRVPNAVSQEEIRRAQSDLEVAKTKLEHTASELHHVIGLIGEKSAANDPRSTASATSAAATRRSQMPQGPVAERVKSILDERTDLGFADNPTPLKDVADYIASKHKLPIYIHPNFDAGAIIVDRTFKDVPLRYAFEGIQELTQGEISFVVRDYGILVVPKVVADDNGYVSAVDFGRDRAGAKTGAWPSQSPMSDPPRQGSSFGSSRDYDAAPKDPSSKADGSRNY